MFRSSSNDAVLQALVRGLEGSRVVWSSELWKEFGHIQLASALCAIMETANHAETEAARNEQRPARPVNGAFFPRRYLPTSEALLPPCSAALQG